MSEMQALPPKKPIEPESQAPPQKRHNCSKTAVIWWAIIIILLVKVSLVIIAAVALGCYFGLREDSDEKECLTPDVCNSEVLNHIDNSADPCNDFYQYSCGKWLSANPLGDRDSWGTINQLDLRNFHHLRRYVSGSPQQNDPDAIKKAKYIYSACTDVTFIENNFVSHLQDFIRDAGGWSTVGIYGSDYIWNINYDLAGDHYLGSSAFFDFGIIPDDLNSSLPKIRVRQGGLTLRSLQQYSELGEDYFDLVDLIEAVLSLVSGDARGLYYSKAHDIADYERQLAMESLTDTELRNISARYNPMTLQEFFDLFNLDWVKYFNAVFSRAGFTPQFNANTIVIVETPDYFRNVNRLLSSSVTVDYVKWQLLINELAMSIGSLDLSWGILRKMKFPKTAKLAEASSMACVELVEIAMPLAIARPFVEDFIIENITDIVNKVTDEISDAFIERLRERNWLDNTTKDQCADKVNSITRQIAYPDLIKIDSELDAYYENLDIDNSMNHFEIIASIREFIIHRHFSRYMNPTDKTEWLAPPTAVNAYYAPQFNQFAFLAGILRPPVFASNWPPFLVYGALGSIIAHELTHGFDDQGQQFNKDGNRVRWWTNQSLENFRQRTQCFVDQYGQYNWQGYNVDSQLTLGENIADNGGLQTAYHAYTNVMNATVRQSTIRGHTLDQLFFVSFAQLWCSKINDDTLELNTQTDPHSPRPIRVLGSVVNSEEFATAFNCPRRSRMNPTNKCQLW